MARMIKSKAEMTFGVKLSTVFEDGTQTDRVLKPNDIVEHLRYVKDGDISIVNGRIADIVYNVDRLTWDPTNPSDTLVSDMKLKDLVIDTSEKYNASYVNVPLFEVVEFEEETNVARMRYSPYVVCDMQLKYSDYRVQDASISVGDIFDGVKILDLENIENPITGKFEVVGFAYRLVEGKIVVTGIAFKNVIDGNFCIASFDTILSLNEVFTHIIPDAASIAEVIANLNPGDTIKIETTMSTSNNPITIDKANIGIELANDIVCDGKSNSGIRLTGNGSAVISGDGVIVNNTAYTDSTTGYGVASAKGNSTLIFNGGGVRAVIVDDPVHKGQFGVCVYDNAKLVINDGDFVAGWYCVSGNGSTTKEGSSTVINGGSFKSVSDYAIYHPDKSKLVINGGTIVGAAGAIAANAGTIEINGGEFAVLGNGNTGEWADGTSGLQDVALNLNARYGDIVCRITGGTFHATSAGTILIATGSAHNVDLQISGGKFTSKPNPEWIAPGYLCTGEPDDEGFYKVYKALL